MASRSALCLALAAGLLGPSTGWAATYPCEPSPNVRKELRRISQEIGSLAPAAGRDQRRSEMLRELLQRHPDDLFVHRKYQSGFLVWRSGRIRAGIEEYRLRMESRPEDPASLYLYGRLLVGRDTPEARRLFELALQAESGFHWAHLGLVEVYQVPAFKDLAKVRAHLASYMDLCPSSLLAYPYVARLAEPAAQREGAAKLRSLLAGRGDPEDLALYETLWSLEFAGRPTPEHRAVRRGVAEDLRRLARLGAGRGAERLAMLRRGYKLAGDGERARRAEERILREFPASSEARTILLTRWNKEHPFPESDASRDAYLTYHGERLRAVDRWLERWPDEPFLWSARLWAVAALDDLPASELEKTADGLFRTSAKPGGPSTSSPDEALEVARLYAERRVRLDRVEALVRDALEQAEENSREDQESDYFPAEEREPWKDQLRFTRWSAWEALVRAALGSGRLDRGREVLAEMSEALREGRPAEDASSGERSVHADREATLWEWTGRLAEAEGHRLDALASYQSSLAARPSGGAGGREWEPDTVAEAARRLWTDLGGTDEGWRAVESRLETARRATEEAIGSRWETKSTPLPDFELSDLKGRAWKLSDLKGRISYVNLWATWCAPCRVEHPHLQKLYEKLKDRHDVQVLTLSVDSQVGEVEPYMKEKGFTFPVLLAHGYVEGFLPAVSIPRNWIVSAEGVLIAEQIGFGSDGDRWIEESMAMIEKAAPRP